MGKEDTRDKYPGVTEYRISEVGLTEEHFEETRPFFETLFGQMPMYGQGGIGKSDAKGFEFTSNIWVFGVIFKRGHLDIKQRALAILAGLTVGQRLDVARVWINACLNLGCTEDEVKELIIFTSYFGGHPAMRDVALKFGEVIAKRKVDPNLKMV